MHAKVLTWSICVPSLVLIAQIIFLLNGGHTHRHTHTHSHRCHWLFYPHIGYCGHVLVTTGWCQQHSFQQWWFHCSEHWQSNTWHSHSQSINTNHNNRSIASSLFNLCARQSFYTTSLPSLWPGTLHFILHTFLHPIIIFFSQPCPYHRNLFCCSTEIVSSIPSLSLNSTWNSIFYLNVTRPSDRSHLCPLKCHLIFFPYRPGLTSTQHVISHTTAVPHQSIDQVNKCNINLQCRQSSFQRRHFHWAAHWQSRTRHSRGPQHCWTTRFLCGHLPTADSAVCCH